VVSGTGDKVSERSDGTSYVDGLEAVRSLGSEEDFQDSCPHAWRVREALTCFERCIGASIPQCMWS
jgi:hypothetical protein